MSVSGWEQLLIELVNRARLDPVGEADRMELTEGLDALPQSALQPLAPDAALWQAAETHSNWMMTTDTFSHTGAGGSSAGQRMVDAGYGATGTFAWAENIAFRGSSGTLDMLSAVEAMHRNLFLSEGHRLNILSSGVNEIGIGHVTGTYQSYNSAMVTQNFARDNDAVFVTGVAYSDDDGNDFYSVGEGMQGVTIASGGASAASQAAGGYSLAVTGGDTTVTFTTAVGAMSASVNMDGENVKIDVVDGTTLMASADVTLGAGGLNAGVLGVSDLDATGNSTGNVLIGNSGDNTLSGRGGDDTLTGGAGNDRLIGGAGNDRVQGGAGTDTAVISGTMTDIAVFDTTSGTMVFSGAGVDLLSGIEFIELNNGTFALSEVIESASGGANGTWSFQVDANGLDALFGEDGSDFLDGLDGDDILNGGDGDDVLLGGDGADNIAASDGNDFVDGDNGDDLIGGGLGNDTLNGGQGADIIGGGQGHDLIHAGGGKDVASGGAGDDTMDGGAGDDIMGGAFNDDRLSGGGGNDQLGGGTGRDLISGGAGSDSIGGGEGDDTIYGNDNADFLSGGGRHDQIDGGNGADTINGGSGNDTLTGGAGADVFVFNELTNGETDLILDFEDGSDVLRLTGVSAPAGTGAQGRFDALDITAATVAGEAGVTVGYGGNKIKIAGIGVDDLTADDFLFL
ncbi:CAP domain-containing protein [Aestuariicoccus sp. MJ-SS9]|uniref:CAP domain-containing protein n=1 Tax=Aestuariicoccus sp. MJ-SS9 TaxID=3079855 RepID=UPI0029146761|nr:CAP domain-containing protein [Aestuariicoccus sp. MJ-SS9]MDU8913674.1 CAP domain-containing protein [Aestuariicoccus sp. MJ-SS9]